jgi:hypothetical protein
MENWNLIISNVLRQVPLLCRRGFKQQFKETGERTIHGKSQLLIGYYIIELFCQVIVQTIE